LTLANTHGVATVPHVWGSGVAVTAALHAVAVIPAFPHTANLTPLLNQPVIEFDRTHNPLRDDLLKEGFALEEGKLKIPEEPGLGLNVREEVLSRYRY
jgi:D-galactarolactone cycloisomerase